MFGSVFYCCMHVIQYVDDDTENVSIHKSQFIIKSFLICSDLLLLLLLLFVICVVILNVECVCARDHSMGDGDAMFPVCKSVEGRTIKSEGKISKKKTTKWNTAQNYMQTQEKDTD